MREPSADPNVGRAEKKWRVEQAKINAQIRRVEARSKRQQRSRETRRKVLIGVLVMGWMQRDEQLRERVYRELDQTLVRLVDRAVFAQVLP